MKIVFASHNVGKIKELQNFFLNQPVEIIPQNKFNVPEIEETGLSFIENALLKARHAAQITGIPAIADDSGLVIDALNGAPGIYSARYASEKANAKENMAKVLHHLKGVPTDQRTARFYCAIAFLKHPRDPTPIICQASWEGRILEEPDGDGGFGYDPIFFVPSENCSAARLTQAQKNNLSHRGLALKKFVKIASVK